VDVVPDGGCRERWGREVTAKATPAASLRGAVEPFLHLDDPWVTDVALATIVANLTGGSDPLWLLLVNPSSTAKTEVVQLFRKIPECAWLAELTVNTFLSGLQREDASGARRGGREHSLLFQWTDPVLRGDRPVVQDLTGLITNQREKRDAVFGQLRQIYDGRLVKHTGMGEELIWEGFLGLLGGVTPRIDQVAELNSSLGERFLLYRPLRRDPLAEARQAVEVAHEGEWLRQAGAQIATAAVVLAAKRLSRVVIPESVKECLVILAQLTAVGRAAVHRDGQKILQFVPQPEGPARLVKELNKLLISLCACRGRSTPNTEDMATLAAVARSSIPALRLRVLQTLLGGGGHAGLIAQRLALPRSTVLYVLQDLQAVGMITREGDETKGFWDLEPSHCKMAEATGFLVAEDEDPRIAPVTPRDPDIETPTTVSVTMRDSHRLTEPEADLGDGRGGPSPATAGKPALHCSLCRQWVPRGVFAAHVAQHERDGS
jgi:hypothetical protein